MKTQQQIIEDIKEQKRLLTPLIVEKSLILRKLKMTNKRIKEHKNTLFYLTDELAKLKEV